VDRGVSVIRTVLIIIVLFMLLMSIVDIYLVKTYGSSDWDITIHVAEYPTEVVGGENFTIVITGYVNIPQGEVGILRITRDFFVGLYKPREVSCDRSFSSYESRYSEGFHTFKLNITLRCPVVYRESFSYLHASAFLFSEGGELKDLSYSSVKFTVLPKDEVASDVKFRGIVTDYSNRPPIVALSINIASIISDPTGTLRIGENIYVFPESISIIENISVGDIVEVFGDYHPTEHRVVVWKGYHYVSRARVREEVRFRGVVKIVDANPENPTCCRGDWLITVTEVLQGEGLLSIGRDVWITYNPDYAEQGVKIDPVKIGDVVEVYGYINPPDYEGLPVITIEKQYHYLKQAKTRLIIRIYNAYRLPMPEGGGEVEVVLDKLGEDLSTIIEELTGKAIYSGGEEYIDIELNATPGCYALPTFARHTPRHGLGLPEDWLINMKYYSGPAEFPMRRLPSGQIYVPSNTICIRGDVIATFERLFTITGMEFNYSNGELLANLTTPKPESDRIYWESYRWCLVLDRDKEPPYDHIFSSEESYYPLKPIRAHVEPSIYYAYAVVTYGPTNCTLSIIEGRPVYAQYGWVRVGLGTLPTVTVTVIPDPVPINRPFSIHVEIYNPSETASEYRVAIYETVYLGAIEVKAFGDKEKMVTIPPGGRGSVELKALIDAPTPLTSLPITLVRVYRGGDLIYEHKVKINATADYASIGMVVSQPFVERGKHFNIFVLGEYSFTYDTKLVLSVIDDGGNTVEQIERLVKGVGLIDDRLIIGSEYTSKSGVRKFTVVVKAYAPELGFKELPIRLPKAKTSESFIVEVGEYGSNNPPSGLYVTPYSFRITYGGKEYIAVRFEDVSVGGYWWQDPDSLFKRFNWVIFDSNYEVVMNDTLYKNLTLIAEVAYLIWSGPWSKESLQNTIKLYEDTAKWFEVAETVRVIGKKVAEFGHELLVTALADGLAPKILAAENEIFTQGLMYTYIFKLKFHIALSECALLDFDYAAACLAARSLRLSAEELKEAINILPSAEGMIDGESTLRFYEKVKIALGRGEGAYRFVVTMVSNQKWYKVFWDLYGTMLLGKAKPTVEEIAEFFTKTYEKILSENPITILFSRMYYYDEWEKYLKEHSLDFREAYLQDLSSSTKVVLREAKGQHKLHLRVYDDQGRVTGYISNLGVVKVEIPGSHYVDLGEGVVVVVPLNTSITKIDVDASRAIEPIEHYNLTISRIQGGIVLSNYTYSGSVKRGSISKFSVEVGEEKIEVRSVTEAIITSTTTTTTPEKEATSLPLTLIVAPIIIVAAIAVILLLKRK